MRFLFLLLVFFAISTNAKEIEEITNQMCPVLTDEKVDFEHFVDYEGKRIFLCCERCCKKFSKNPTKYLANLSRENDLLPYHALLTMSVFLVIATSFFGSALIHGFSHYTW